MASDRKLSEGDFREGRKSEVTHPQSRKEKVGYQPPKTNNSAKPPGGGSGVPSKVGGRGYPEPSEDQ